MRRPVDLPRARRALAWLDLMLARHPELRAPRARVRAERFIAGGGPEGDLELAGEELVAGHPEGDLELGEHPELRALVARPANDTSAPPSAA